MRKCMICGKRGLFLKVDALGRCNECAQKEREKEEGRHVYGTIKSEKRLYL